MRGVIKKWLLFWTGGMLTLAGLITFPLPIPIGLPLLLVGLPLLLKSSRRVKRWLLAGVYRHPTVAQYYAKMRRRR